MNRFHQLPFHRRIRAGFLVSLCTFGLVMILFLYGIGNISATTDAEQQRTLADALRRCAVQNYALTGSYPDTLEDLLALILCLTLPLLRNRRPPYEEFPVKGTLC